MDSLRNIEMVLESIRGEIREAGSDIAHELHTGNLLCLLMDARSRPNSPHNAAMIDRLEAVLSKRLDVYQDPHPVPDQ